MTKTMKIFIFLSVTFVAFASDQWMKSFCGERFRPNQYMSIMGRDDLRLTRVMNQGTMFKSLSMYPPGGNPTITRYMPTALVILFITAFLIFRWSHASFFEFFFFALLMGGGSSNLIDHWRSDFVMDTFGVRIPGLYDIMFNLADLWILIGWMGLIVSLTRAVVHLPPLHARTRALT